MNRRNIILITLIILIGIGFSCKTQHEEQRPNIVFIMSDDHAQQAISCYNGALNKTPNIDRIAESGAIFANSFVCNSICGPSRAAFITGKLSHKNGFLANYRSKFDTTQVTLPKLLRANGYSTALIGKWHLGTLPTGFDHWNIVNDQGDYYNPQFIQGKDTVVVPGYVTNIITDQSIEWMEKGRDKDKPFMLMVQHKAPHRNWMPDTCKLGMYDDVDFALPENFEGDFRGRGTASKDADMGIWKTMSWSHDMKLLEHPEKWEHYKADNPYHVNQYENHEVARMDEAQKKVYLAHFNKKNKDILEKLYNGEMSLEEHIQWRFNRYMQDYLSTISSVDDGVGELLDYLEEKGLDENTIVVYTSDQGFYLGENGWFDKRFMYEQSLRTPFVVKYPKKIKAGTEINELIQNIDFAPTMLEWAGIEIPSDIQGESFAKLFTDGDKTWRDAIYYHYYMYPGTHSVKRHYGVRTDRYKLIHFYHDIDEWELYDLKFDPEEMNNLYGNPEYHKQQKQMHEVLKRKQEEYGDSHELAIKYMEENIW